MATYDNKLARVKDLKTLGNTIKNITDGLDERIEYLEDLTLVLLNAISPLTLDSSDASIVMTLGETKTITLTGYGANSMTLTGEGEDLEITITAVN